MQTFLPYPDFAASARVLDDRRLGKQRVEALQILHAITVPGYGWRHRPAVAMWRGYEEALAAYGAPSAGVVRLLDRLGLVPPWLGDEDFHRAHRSSLLRKDPDRYGPEFGDVPPDLPYVWPTNGL